MVSTSGFATLSGPVLARSVLPRPILLPGADITKMCRINFQGEPLETFFMYEIVKYAEIEDLEVIGPTGPVCSVTVKLPSSNSFKYYPLSVNCGQKSKEFLS